ncbi:MAG: cytochrome c-type biogenesis protein CcmH [Gemmatimonadota bacterium]
MSESLTASERGSKCIAHLVRIGLFLLFVSLAAVGDAEAQRNQDRPNADQAESAIAQLRSPYCPGLMLEVCPSPNAAALRDSIYELAAEGRTSGELIEWMIGRHGEEWRGVPQRSGAGLWAWIMPPLALLLGIGIVVGWLRGNRTESKEKQLAVADVSDADRERLTAAMREWEESGGEEEV